MSDVNRRLPVAWSQIPVPTRQEMRCPTCGAQQAWTDRCRRCKCDLRLLRAAVEAYEHNRELCLFYLDDDDPQSAFQHAQTCHQLRPNPETHQLLALCYFLADDWENALEQAAFVDVTQKAG
jgi:hypothetical protein